MSIEKLSFQDKLAIFKANERSASAKADIKGESYGKYVTQENTGSVLATALKFGSLAPSINNRKVSAGDEFEIELKLTDSPSADENEYVETDNYYDDIDFGLLEPTLTSIPALSIKDANADLSMKPDSRSYQLTFVPEFEEDERDIHADLDWDMTDDSWDPKLETISAMGELCAVDQPKLDRMVAEAQPVRDKANDIADSFAKALSADGEDMDVIQSIDEENEAQAASVVEKHETELMEKDEKKTASVLNKYEVSSVPVSTTLSEVLTPPKRKVGVNLSRLIAVFEPTQSAPSAA